MENPKTNNIAQKTETLSQTKERTKAETNPDEEKFKKLLVDDKKENEQAALPSPFEIMSPDPEPIATEIKVDSSLQLELVNKIVDRMTFQVDNGIEQTTLYLGEESALPGTEITLTHYDTAPDSFHIAIDCAPHIVETVSDHLPHLKKRLEERVPSYQFRVKSPRIKALKN